MKQHHPKASFFPKEKGAYEGRRLWRKQAVVSPVKQGTSQVRFAHERGDHVELWNGGTA